jgi:hypothetical protein
VIRQKCDLREEAEDCFPKWDEAA